MRGFCGEVLTTNSVISRNTYESDQREKIRKKRQNSLTPAFLIFVKFRAFVICKPVSIKHGLRTTDSDYGLGIKHGLGIKRGLSITDLV